MFPTPDGTPQQEFDDFLRRFPEIAEQFRDARTVRPWVRTGRLQYSAYVGFGHDDLWNAVIRVWKATSFMTWVPTQKALSDFRRDGGRPAGPEQLEAVEAAVVACPT